MKTINFYNSPSPHVIIDEFFSPKLAQSCLEECIKLEAFYEPAKTGNVSHTEDDCPTCLKQREYDKQENRKNDVVFLDDLCKSNRDESIILKSLNRQIANPIFTKLFKNKGYFHILNSTNCSEAIISRYGMCDFYGYHVDQIQNQNNRLVTLCYYLNNEPEQFEGGELILTGDTLADTLKIKPKHNRAVLFQSDTTFHAVETVKLLNNEFKHGRFSINFWLSINSEGRYRYR